MKRIIPLLLLAVIQGCANINSIQSRCIEEGNTVTALPYCIEKNLDASNPNWRMTDEHGPAVHEYIECIKKWSEKVNAKEMTEQEAQVKSATKLAELKKTKAPSGSCEPQQLPAGGGGVVGGSILPMPVTCTTTGYGRFSTTICF